MLARIGFKSAAALVALLAVCAAPAIAQNQTPTTSPISLNSDKLPYQVSLRRVDTGTTLPTLQSFAAGQDDGLWVLIGGRTNGLHSFTNNPIKNFPPSAQNRRIWVIDPATWKFWSRPLRDSSLSQRQMDELSATAMESVQVGSTLYVVGGYGYSRDIEDFTTFRSMTAFDLPTIIAWAKREPTEDLKKIIRQTHSTVLQVTGGQMTVMNGRASLVFGQKFIGGYGGVHKQVYTGQVRSFEILDDGNSLAIQGVRQDPATPNLEDFRRRDYNLIPILDTSGSGPTDAAVALSGVFTLTNGVWTVPVEVDASGVPTMADPDAPETFKQGMNNYNTANLVLFDSRTGANHALMFGGISYEKYKPKQGFVENAKIPFINDATAIRRQADGTYRQFLLQSAKYPNVVDAGGAHLLFGAEAAVFLKPDTALIGNGLVDLRAEFGDGEGARVIGWIFGGIAAEKPNFGESVASNEVFEIVLGPAD